MALLTVEGKSFAELPNGKRSETAYPNNQCHHAKTRPACMKQRRTHEDFRFPRCHGAMKYQVLNVHHGKEEVRLPFRAAYL